MTRILAPCGRCLGPDRGRATAGRRPGARLAPLRLRGRSAAGAAGGVGQRDPAAVGGRARAGGRDVVVVGGDPRVRPPGPEPGAARPGGPDGARDVRRTDPRAGGAAGPAAGRDHPDFADPGVLRRLRLGVGRGRGEDGAAVLAGSRPAGPAAAAHRAWRLPRRHHRGDVGLRPGDRHARPVPGLGAAAGLCRAPPPPLRRAGARLRSRRGRQPARPVRRAAGGRDRRADRAGRRRDAVLRPGVPDPAGRAVPRGRRTAAARRDRHRLRPDRALVRQRVGRGGARRTVRGQGVDRRLPDDGGRTLHRRGRGRRERRAGRRADARPHVHGQPAGGGGGLG